MKEVKGIGPARYLSDGYMNLALIDVNSPGLNLKEGLYHIGFEVDDIEPLRESLTAMGTSSKLEPGQRIGMLNSVFTIQMEMPLIFLVRAILKE